MTQHPSAFVATQADSATPDRRQPDRRARTTAREVLDAIVQALSASLLGGAPSPRPGGTDAGRVETVRWLKRMMVLSATFVLTVAWVSVAVVLHLKRQDAINAEIRQNTNLARAFEEQTARVLATTDQAIHRLRQAWAADGQVPGDIVKVANETGLVPGIMAQLSLVDATGRFIGSNLDPDGSKTGHVDLTSREHVRAHLAPDLLRAEDRLANPADLFIGKPVLGKVSKKWTIQLSRRVAAADGTVLGVIVASLDPVYFEDVYKRVSLGRLGGVALVGRDLNLRARVIGGQSNGMGSTASTNSPFAREAKGREGSYIGPSSLDGVNRIGSYRQVAEFPLYLLVITSEDEALSEWRLTRSVTVGLSVALSLAVLLGVTVVLVSLQRLEQGNAALRASEAKANAANQAKSEFLAAISHELRTPLTSIRGFAELMEHRLDQPKFREQAGLIRKGAEHLNQLLTQILDLAKVEAGAMPLTPESVEIRPLIQGTVDFFSLAAAGKGLELRQLIAPDVPERLVCDDLRVKQVLNNLLSNAMKFTTQGSVTLGVERAGPQQVVFYVQDTGPGIPLELQETIFEKFRQANARISHDHGGTGLGLALSRGLAELMKGSLTLHSVPGQGSRFSLVLPIGPAD